VRSRRRYVPLVGVLGVAAGTLPAIASSETPPIEAVNAGLYSHYWSPSQATVVAGSVITFRNPSSTPHGVEWRSGPAKPECNSGVPVGTTEAVSGKEWSGTCTFSQAGTYTFYCTVHGPEMTGTITVSADGTTTTTTGTTTTSPTTSTPTTTSPPPEVPSGGPPAGAPSLRASQRGESVKGSLVIGQAGAGGRLEVDLFAKSAALGRAGHKRRVRVGRLVRGSVSAGRMSFVVALDSKARRTLKRKRRLSLSVQITLTPVHGNALTVKRAVVEHA
jgi:plastocyanin